MLDEVVQGTWGIVFYNLTIRTPPSPGCRTATLCFMDLLIELRNVHRPYYIPKQILVQMLIIAFAPWPGCMFLRTIGYNMVYCL